MVEEFTDFQTRWESRILAVMGDHLDPQPYLSPGSRQAEYTNGALITVTVEMGAEEPPRSGWYECAVAVDYDPAETTHPNDASNTWRQIEEALGDGTNGAAPLRDRLASGNLVLPGGLDSINYDDGSSNETDGRRLFTFTAILGVAA